MNRLLLHWAPGVLLCAGAVLTHGVGKQRSLPLVAELADVVPERIDGLEGAPLVLSDGEVRVAGVSDYLLRAYGEGDGPEWAQVYVGYYASQTQGRTIHSPKNCLPGSGWEPLQSETASIGTASAGEHLVNRYILQRGDEQALVLYWYQGRGRVAHNEYLVKLDLLRDATFRQRSDEALVRVVVPITGTEGEAFRRAASFASTLIPAVDEALPRV